MTIPNRTVAITGVFAEDATTTIPQSPISGISYRNASMTQSDVKAGWKYKTIVDSANVNEALYEYATISKQIEKYGFLPWCALTDYVAGSLCLGSNGFVYQAKQATGPSSTAYDPVNDTNGTYWRQFYGTYYNILFAHEWYDYEISNQSWVRADTFSWQDGTVYKDAYDHLVDDIDGVSSTTETIGSYTITYYPAADGHKIVLANQETTVANIYSESGVAWYYILDTTNTRFKLPRTKYGFTGLRDDVGKYVEAGLPNLSLYTPNSSEKYGSQPNSVYNIGSTSGNTNNIITTALTDKLYVKDDNNIVGNSTTVQPPATQMYLYFYVGQFSQLATDQTAGLNSELFNGKADIDLSNAAPNASASAKQTIVGWGIPDYSSGVSVSSGDSASSNGIVAVTFTGGNGGVTLDMYVNNVQITTVRADYNNQHFFAFPVSKNDVITYTKNKDGYYTSIVFYPCIGG